MADNQTPITNSTYQNGDPLKGFQLERLSISEKSTKEWGQKIAKKIWGYSISSLGGYYWNRNQRFLKNDSYAHGTLNVQAMFQDRFDFNGKQNYIRLDWKALQIVNRIITGLVGRWMQRGEKVVVTAIDDQSQLDKQQEYQDILNYLQNKAQFDKLQQASGVPLAPQMQHLPADEEELNLWRQEFQRIPEEIVTEMGCNDVLGTNGWFDVLKEKMLWDSAVKGLVGTYTWMDDTGVVHIDWVKPDNMIYSASDYPDFRDWTWLGEIPDMKISELRRLYGKEFNPDNPNALTEEQIWAVAQTAKEYKSVSGLNWVQDWVIPFNMRPYDEWNVRSMKFELKTVDSDPFTVTTTKTNTTYTQKGYPLTASGKPKSSLSENQKLYKDTNVNIFRGVYLPDNDILLEWGLKKNMIRPQDPKESGNAESSYSFYMYQNFQMRNLAIPEKIQAAVDGMILALLKMQQVMARLVPVGWAIDETKLNDIDYGLGDANKEVDHAQMFFQTGLMYYRGIDAEGNRTPEPPIKELANSGFVNQMAGLIQNYQFNYQTLKDELGEDPNLITAAVQPRVTAANVETSQNSANNATDYMYRAYAECMKMTARKITCLLKDSIQYGSEAYRKIVGDADLSNKIFSTDIKLLPTEQEVMAFDTMMQQAMNTTPELALFLNPLQALEMVKQDVKLAWAYYRQCQKKMLIWKQQTTEQNQQATIQGQIASAQAAEQAKQQTEQVKGNIEIELKKIEGENQNKNATINMVSAILSKGLDVPPQYAPFVSAVMQNVMLPLAVENEQNRQAIIQQMNAAAMQQQEQQTPQQQPIQQQPPQAA